MVKENIRMEENVEISAINRSEETVKVGDKEIRPGVKRLMKKHNEVVEVGLKYAVERLWAEYNRNEEISHLAFGAESTSTSSGMTSLVDEKFRGEILSQNIEKVSNAEVQAVFVIATGTPTNQPVNFGEVSLQTDVLEGSDDLMFSRVGLGADDFQKTQEIEVRVKWQIGIINQ